MGFSILGDRERTMVEKELKKLASINPEMNFDSPISNTKTNNIHKVKSERTAVNTFLQSVGHESMNTKGKRATLVEEFRTYRLLADRFMELKDTDATVLDFWSTHTHELPMLSTFARRFLATPGTSVPSESAFSISGFIGRKERCRLTPENLAATVFLKDKLE